MGKLLGETESLCPVCLKRIPARKVADNGKVYLEKTCPEHGESKVLIWRQDARHYLDWAKGSEKGSGPLHSFTAVDKGCPYDCGLCPEHWTRACTMVMEVTLRCNLKCPVCFASADKNKEHEPDIEVIRGMYEAIMEGVGACTIQLSGGEPTVRDDLPQIAALGREAGFNHILINTNGLRIAREPDYLRRLKDAGASAIYLQFDGVTDDVYRYTRGRNLFDIKRQALDNCTREKIGVILVPTIIPGVNDHQLGDIVRFAKSRIPTVKGIHFQPISYLGRYPHPPSDEDRITIPDVIRALESQTEGELKWQDFLPRHAQDSHCAFSSFFILTEEGKLQAISNLARGRVTGWGSCTEPPPEESSRRFMSRHWRLNESHCPSCNAGDFYDRLLNYYLTITCMPFQDVWSVDIDRLRGCCGHVVTPDRRIIPFCAYYLTNTSGERLYSTPLLVGNKVGQGK
ncbi:MAG: radical SAM protein [Dehalococcoidia bacterium]|nr:MAG: radical SAM protein [Dehalococcoidia bacterium]